MIAFASKENPADKPWYELDASARPWTAKEWDEARAVLAFFRALRADTDDKTIDRSSLNPETGELPSGEVPTMEQRWPRSMPALQEFVEACNAAENEFTESQFTETNGTKR